MAYDFKKLTVLVVESSHVMFDLTHAVLDTFGVGRILPAFGFQRGFEIFCAENPDLILIDWLEEPMNGLMLTKKIRTDAASPNPYVPIILMSGHGSLRRVVTARDAGITAFVAKPYTARALYNRIEHLIENPRRFVKSEKFFGPDRRAGHAPLAYAGPDRRQPETPHGGREG